MNTARESGDWLKNERARLAEDRILDAAGEGFVELGVAHTSMEDVARLANCSRGTVYRYFKNRHELRLAYIEREAKRILAVVHEATVSIDDPAEAILQAITAALSQVRGNPTLAPWFNPEGQGTTNVLAGSSETMFEMTTLFLDTLLEPAANAGRLRQGLNRRDAAEWLTRVMLSLLSVRGPRPRTPEQELDYLRTFLLPALLAD